MSTFKKAKIVILPTNEAKGDFSKKRIYPCLLKHSWMFDKEEKGKLIFTDSNIRTPTQLQHLYIISDDEIKESDWFYNIHSKIVGRAAFNFGKDELAKKIIATTNNSLTEDRQKTACVVTGHPLPQPSQQFIQKFVEKYNKGNVITDVLVEYEKQYNPQVYGTAAEKYSITERLKINPKDNTITIKKVKDSYSREEVIEFGNKVKEYCKDGWKPDSLHRVFFEWDKWVEENL